MSWVVHHLCRIKLACKADVGIAAAAFEYDTETVVKNASAGPVSGDYYRYRYD